MFAVGGMAVVGFGDVGDVGVRDCGGEHPAGDEKGAGGARGIAEWRFQRGGRSLVIGWGERGFL